MDYTASSLNYNLNNSKLTFNNKSSSLSSPTELSTLKSPITIQANKHTQFSSVLNDPSSPIPSPSSSSSISIEVYSNNQNNNNKIKTENLFKDNIYLPSSQNLNKIGKLFILYKKENEIIYVMGPLFPLFLLILLIVHFLLYFFIFKNAPMIFRMIGIIISCSQIFLFVLSSIKNPGLPKKEYENLIYEEENKNSKSLRQCKDCKLWINTDEKAIHCKKCKVCIEGYDHHCDTMNICIGKNNLKIFYFCMLMTFITGFYSVCVFLRYK